MLIYTYVPGFMALQVTVDFWEISLRASSKEVITLHYIYARVHVCIHIKFVYEKGYKRDVYTQ